MRDFIIMIGFVGLLPICFIRPFAGVLVWTWFSMMQPHRETFGFSFSFSFNMYIAIVTFIALITSKEKNTPMYNTPIILMLIFFIWSCFTLIFALDPVQSWVFFNLTPSRVYIYIFMLVLLVNSEERMIALIWMVVVSLGYYGASLGVSGILAGGYNIGRADSFGPPDTMIEDRNHLTVALLMVFPLMLYLHNYSQKIFMKMILKIVSVLSIITVVASYSRTAILCLMMISGYYFLFVRNKILIIISTVIIFGVAFTFMPLEWQERMSFSQEKIETDGSMNIRFEAWKLAQAIANNNPITGGGFRIGQNGLAMQLYPDVSKNPRPHAVHNIYYEVLSDHGYVGFFLFISVMIGSVYMNVSTRKISKNDTELIWVYDLATALQLSIAVYALGGAALSLAYFDLAYVLFTLSAILNILLKKKILPDSRTKKRSRFSATASEDTQQVIPVMR